MSKKAIIVLSVILIIAVFFVYRTSRFKELTGVPPVGTYQYWDKGVRISPVSDKTVHELFPYASSIFTNVYPAIHPSDMGIPTNIVTKDHVKTYEYEAKAGRFEIDVEDMGDTTEYGLYFVPNEPMKYFDVLAPQASSLIKNEEYKTMYINLCDDDKKHWGPKGWHPCKYTLIVEGSNVRRIEWLSE